MGFKYSKKNPTIILTSVAFLVCFMLYLKERGAHVDKVSALIELACKDDPQASEPLRGPISNSDGSINGLRTILMTSPNECQRVVACLTLLDLKKGFEGFNFTRYEINHRDQNDPVAGSVAYGAAKELNDVEATEFLTEVIGKDNKNMRNIIMNFLPQRPKPIIDSMPFGLGSKDYIKTMTHICLKERIDSMIIAAFKRNLSMKLGKDVENSEMRVILLKAQAELRG